MVAYTELNDPREVVPLTEVLAKISPSEMSRFIRLKKRSFQCDGIQFNSPYYDLFLRSWTKAAELYNELLL